MEWRGSYSNHKLPFGEDQRECKKLTRLRKTAAALTAVLSLNLLAGCGLVVKTDEAIARDEAERRGIILVEGDGIKVTLGEVEDEYDVLYQSWLAQYGEEGMETLAPQLEQQKIQIMDNKMRTQLMQKKADDLNIPTESEEMDREYEEIIAENVESAGGQEEFDELLETNGYTTETYKSEVMMGLRLEQLLEDSTADVTVSDAEVTEYYEENKEADFTEVPGATIYHIFFGKPDDAAAEAKAKEAKTRLDGGAEFADIAKEYGQDSSAASGGLLGNYPYDTNELGADFMAEAEKLDEGEISGPVKTSFGWHIIHVTDVIKEERVQALDDEIKGDDGTTQTLREEIRNLLLSDKKNARIAELLDEWEAEYNVKRYPERIPMEYPAETPGSTQPTATGGSTQPATTEPSTQPAATEASTQPAATEPSTQPAGTEATTQP